ncbi:hypothetical protein L7F22_058739 [Adiantum nelumboides]|nr:hypothetical protein [Adiantum nelumboides]
MKREGAIQRVLDGASTLLLDYVDVPGGITVPPASTLELYYGVVVMEARKFLFPLEVALESKNTEVKLQAIKKIDYYRMIEIEREQQYQNEATDFDLGRRDTEAAISDASPRYSRRRIAERAQRRSQRADKGRRREEDISDTSRRSGRNGSTRANHRYHSKWVAKSDSETGTSTDESSLSPWRMNTGRLPDMTVRTSEFELFVTRFDGSDFAWWNSHRLDALTCLGQALPLQGKDARPDSMSDSAWEDLDALARSTIMLSLVESVYCTRDVLRARSRLDATALTTSKADDVYEVTHDDEIVLASMYTPEVIHDMPLPMSDSLSHGTFCVDVIARETDVCEPYMAMLIDTELVDEPDFQESETDVLFYDASNMFEDDNVLQTPMYAHGELAMIANLASDLDVLSQELLSRGVMSTGLAHEGIAHGGEQEVDTILLVWLDATSSSDARTILGTSTSLVEHESSTHLPLCRRLSEFDRHLELVGIG